MNTVLAQSHPIRRSLRERFARLYGESMADLCAARALMMVGRYAEAAGEDAFPRSRDPWSEKTAVLIAYPDHVTGAAGTPLASLREFVSKELGEAFDAVHILPFFPSSSDDGFSVIHYRQVAPHLGTWDEICEMSKRFRLVFDLVLNHVSRQSGWFRDFTLGIAPARHYFIEKQEKADYSAVVRPRPLPLFSPVRLRNGRTTEVWTTFSEDQIDLNYACPDVLFEMLDIALLYAQMGASVLRLDAVAYLWKKEGTPCIHLSETHEIVKIFRDFLSVAAPGLLLLTETNVPHAENVSYFGAGDEAHMVYQFSLPPLVLHAALTGCATHLTKWAADLCDPPRGCTFLNFTASHDGIGVRPLEGIVPDQEIARLIAEIRRRGGAVSTRATADGTEKPYELNITWFDAVVGEGVVGERDIGRFLATQSVPLVLKGVPAVYFSSLFGGRNDHKLVEATGRARSINRTKWRAEDLETRLGNPSSHERRVWDGCVHMLRARRGTPVFHPDGTQRVISLDDRVFAVERIAPDQSARALCIINFSENEVMISAEKLSQHGLRYASVDMLSGRRLDTKAAHVQPYEVLWLTDRP